LPVISNLKSRRGGEREWRREEREEERRMVR
jgi:hypothetical protein